MSSRYKYTSLDRVFAKLNRDGIDNFNEDDIIEWTGEALEFMSCVKSYEEAVCFVEVKNFRCAIPKWSHAIIQIAKDNVITSGIGVTAFTKQVTEIVNGPQVVIDSNGNYITVDPVTMDNSLGIFNFITKGSSGYSLLPTTQSYNETGIEINRGQISLQINYKVWIDTPYYRGRFSPVRLKTSSFFDSIVCTEIGIPYDSCADEYDVEMGDTLKFSFQEGLVAIAYLKQAVDTSTGYPMVPDHPSFLAGIVWYIDLMMATKDFRKGREGATGRMNKAEDKWNWYCKQATNVDMMPYGIDEHQNLLDQRSYLLPRQNQYYNFFGNLGKGEVRHFNNPNRRKRY